MTLTSLLLAGALTAAGPVAPNGSDRPLVSGSSVEHPLGSGATDVYVIHLEAGQFLRLTVVELGVDAAVVLIAPDGSRTEVDVATDQQGREPASLLAETSGRWRVEVRWKSGPPSAGYRLDSEAVRAATENDRARSRGEREIAEGARRLQAGSGDALRGALARFAEALAAWRAAGDRYWEAETLLLEGAARLELDDSAGALEIARGALPLWRELDDHRGQARTLNLAGEAHYNQGALPDALERFREALGHWQALGHPRGEAEALSNISVIYGALGERSKFLDANRDALALLRRAGDRAGEAVALSNRGGALSEAGALQEGLDLLYEARGIQRALGDRPREASTLMTIATLSQRLGDYEGALLAYTEVLATWRALGSRRNEAVTLLNMGHSHFYAGDFARAGEHYEQALAQFRSLGDRVGEAHALMNLGRVFSRRGDREDALAHFEQSLKLAQETGDRYGEAAALVHRGDSRAAAGLDAGALQDYQRALDLSRGISDPRLASAVLQRLAQLALDGGDVGEARARIEAALDAVESQRRRLTSLDRRSFFDTSQRGIYELHIEVLMEAHRRDPAAGFDARAFEASEQARARGLLDLLAEASVEVREGADPALLDAERSARDRLSVQLDRQMRLLAGRHTPEQDQTAAREIHTLTVEWEAARAHLKAASPRYAALKEPAPVTTADIQKHVLDADTVLLEYALGEKKSFLWAVTPGAIAVFELPPRAVIEAAAREVYDQLAARSPQGAGADDAPGRLAAMVLAPAAGALRPRRLLVVADGALHYIPFAALPDPAGKGEPLIVRHEVVGAPSASVLTALRREERRRTGKTLAVLADPVFDRRDERFRSPLRAAAGALAAAAGPTDRGLERAAHDAGLSGALPRLPFTRGEANAILAVIPPAEGKEALDFDASRATLEDPSLQDYRIVHLATHGFLNSVRPELSGIVLSLVDRNGRDDRGFLTTADVFNLRLAADLVVLSGCRTALGREIKGEGLVGLTRGFMYAGARSVLASLWKVDDESTAALMAAFYRAMLGPARLSPPAALREAQLELRAQRRWGRPYHWAPFQLQGEWR